MKLPLPPRPEATTNQSINNVNRIIIKIFPRPIISDTYSRPVFPSISQWIMQSPSRCIIFINDATSNPIARVACTQSESKRNLCVFPPCLEYWLSYTISLFSAVSLFFYPFLPPLLLLLLLLSANFFLVSRKSTSYYQTVNRPINETLKKERSQIWRLILKKLLSFIW